MKGKWIKTGVALLIVGGLIYYYNGPRFWTLHANDSPDGRYRYISEVQDPPFTQASPVIYRYRVIDLRTGREIPGTRVLINADSCHYDKYEQPHVWTKEEIEELDRKTGVK